MKIKHAHILTREVLPFLASLLTLGAVALLFDALLHLLNAVWVGRYLGIPGVLLIVGSFGYSLRKRRLIQAGKPADLLRLHERMAWAGSLLVLVHAGIHFNAILGWLAIWASRHMIAFASHRVRSPSAKTGTLPFGLRRRKASVRCSPAARSIRTRVTGAPTWRATAQALRGFSVSA